MLVESVLTTAAAIAAVTTFVVAGIIVGRLSLDPDTAKAICDAHLQMGIWHTDGGLTAENVQYTLDFLINTGALQSGLTVQDVADLSYLKAILDDLAHQKSLLIEAQ